MRLIRLHVLEIVNGHQLLLQRHLEEEVDQVVAETCFDVALFEAVLVVGEEGAAAAGVTIYRLRVTKYRLTHV